MLVLLPPVVEAARRQSTEPVPERGETSRVVVERDEFVHSVVARRRYS